MTPIEFANKHGLTVASQGAGDCRDISGVYCSDLLSLVMGRAKEGDVLVTVMGNINTIAVGVLADVSAIILCEGIHFDAQSLKRANDQEVCVLESGESSFQVALKLARELKLC